MEEVVEGVEVGFLEMVSDDSNRATINVATTQQSTVWSIVQEVAHTVLLRWRAITERVV